MKRSTVVVGITAVMLVFSRGAIACVRDLPAPIAVRSHFDILLQDRGRPLIGAEVLVQRYNSSEKWETVKVAVTDMAGRARFADVPVGEFFVGTHAVGGGNDGREIRVTEDQRQKVVPEIQLVWPAKRVIVTSSFEGIFTSLPIDETPSEPLRGVKLDVIEAHSGSLEASLVTDEQGRFALKTLPPGMYFLRLSRENRSEDERIWGWKLEGDVAVEVNPLQRDAPKVVELRLMMTDCGLMYRNAK